MIFYGFTETFLLYGYKITVIIPLVLLRYKTLNEWASPKMGYSNIMIESKSAFSYFSTRLKAPTGSHGANTDCNNYILASHLISNVCTFLEGKDLHSLCKAFPEQEKNIRTMREPDIHDRLGIAATASIKLKSIFSNLRQIKDPLLAEALVQQPLSDKTKLKIKKYDSIIHLAMSPKGDHHIIYQTEDNGSTFDLEVIDKKGKSKKLLTRENTPLLLNIHWLKNSDKFITCSADTVLLWQTKDKGNFSEKNLYQIPHGNLLKSAVLSDDENLLFTLSAPFLLGPSYKAILIYKDSHNGFSQEISLPYFYDKHAHLRPSSKQGNYQIIGNKAEQSGIQFTEASENHFKFSIISTNSEHNITEEYTHPTAAMKYVSSQNGMSVAFTDINDKLHIINQDEETGKWIHHHLPYDVQKNINKSSRFQFDDQGNQLALRTKDQLLMIELKDKTPICNISVLDDNLFSLSHYQFKHFVFLATGNELAVGGTEYPSPVLIYLKNKKDSSWSDRPHQKLDFAGVPIGTDSAGRRLVTQQNPFTRNKGILIYDRAPLVIDTK